MDLKVSHMTVLAQTVEKLRGAIMSGELAPGERLVEAALCDRTGVSRTSIREALRRLEAERLITFTPNRGPSVTNISWENAKDIYEARALLEGEAAAKFAKKASREEIAEVSAAMSDFRRAVKEDSSADQLSSTGRFYSVIFKGCGNTAIAELLEGLTARITLLRARSMSLSGRARFSAREMNRILDAIKKKDPEAARAAAIEHVQSASAAAYKYYMQMDTGGSKDRCKTL